jgi:hypothetical protein
VVRQEEVVRTPGVDSMAAEEGSAGRVRAACVSYGFWTTRSSLKLHEVNYSLQFTHIVRVNMQRLAMLCNIDAWCRGYSVTCEGRPWLEQRFFRRPRRPL